MYVDECETASESAYHQSAGLAVLPTQVVAGTTVSKQAS